MAGMPAPVCMTTPAKGGCRVTDYCQMLPHKALILLISLRCTQALIVTARQASRCADAGGGNRAGRGKGNVPRRVALH